MIHSIDNDGFSRIHVMAVRTHTPNCSRCAFSAAAPMDFRGKKTDLESKRKQFRYGYYCIIIIDVQCCCCDFIVANMMHTLRYALHTLEPNIRGAEAWWCNQFFCICCIAWYSVCIFFFTLQQNHYLGIVRNNSNNKKFIYYK